MNKIIYFLAFFSIACAVYVKATVEFEPERDALTAYVDGVDVVYQYGNLFPKMALVTERPDGNGFYVLHMDDIEVYAVKFKTNDCLQLVIRGLEVNIDSQCIKNVQADE